MFPESASLFLDITDKLLTYPDKFGYFSLIYLFHVYNLCDQHIEINPKIQLSLYILRNMRIIREKEVVICPELKKCLALD